MKTKIAFTGNPEEDLYRTLSQHISRETERAKVDKLFGGNAAENRKKDRSALEKLFIQTPAAQINSPNLLKESSIFGASVPGEVEHAAIPYKTRKDAYTGYLKEKSKEKETGYVKGGLGGAAIGAGLGALHGVGRAYAHGYGTLGGVLARGLIGGAAGGVLGLALAHADKGNIAEAKEVLKSGKIDAHLAQVISQKIEDRESRKELREGLRHARTLQAIEGLKSSKSEPSEVHHYHHEQEKKPQGRCTNCGAPAPDSGSTCKFCDHKSFTKSSCANVDAFLEKLSEAANAPDDAQRRYPELLKVAQTPSPNLKPRPSNTVAVRSNVAGGSA